MRWILLILALSVPAFAQYAPLSPVAAPFTCVDMNSNSQWPDGGANPLVRFTCVRIWDTPGASGWAQIETSAGSYVFTTLDTVLTKAVANGVTYVSIPLNRIPTFYSSNSGDTTCGYYVSIGSGVVNTVGTAVTRTSGTPFLNTWLTIIINGVNYSIASFTDSSHITLSTSAGSQTGVAFDTPSTNVVSGPGQCDMPTDINTDGSGTNLKWKNFIAAEITHVHSSFPSLKMILEEYNEADTCKFLNVDPTTQGSCTGTATLAQLGRWMWDLRCIAKDTALNNPYVAGQSCATARGLVTSVALSGPIDTTAIVLGNSFHGAPFSYNLAQNSYYCNHAPVPPNCGAGISSLMDGPNFHFKYLGKPAVYGDATTTLEAVADTWISGLVAILQPADLIKPFYNTEGGAAAGGWVDCTTTGSAPPYCNYTDPDMEASAVARNNIYQVWKGVTQAVWYDWSTSSGLHGLGGTLDTTHKTDKAYDTSGQWIQGARNMSCVTSAPGTVKAGLFTFTCSFLNATNVAQAVIWDNSQDCAAGVCTTTNQTVSSAYTTYSALDGTAPVAISGHLVPVGIKPLLLNGITTGISGVTIKGLKLSQNTLGPPNYFGSILTNATYSVTTPFNTLSVYNATTHSTLNPTTDCITLMTDVHLALLTTLDTSAMTFSGGDNDVMSSSQNTYFGFKSGGPTHILKMDATGRCIQLVGSEDSTLSFGGPFGFSRIRDSTHDSTLYHVQNFDIWTQEQIGVYPAFSTIATFDIRNCPGPMGQGIDPASGAILGISQNDTVFGSSVSWYGGQGTGHMAWAYKPGTGCATMDYATGNWYAYAGSNGGRQVNSAAVGGGHATFTMAATCPYTNGQIVNIAEPNLVSPATPNAFDGNWTVTTACSGGTTWVATPNGFSLPGAGSSNGWTAYIPSGTQTTCTNSSFYTGLGIHDTQTGLNGLTLVTSGACFDQIGSGAAIWEIGTGNVAQGSASLNHFTGHESTGVTKVVQTNNPNPNIRSIYPLSQAGVNAYTTIGPLPGNLAETHGFWPHPAGDDSNPWINCTATGTGYLTPTYLQNTCFGLTTDGSGVIRQFTPTFNSGTVSSSQFGMEFAIGFGFQDGTGMCWLSDLNLAFGLDSGGNQAGAILCAKLE